MTLQAAQIVFHCLGHKIFLQIFTWKAECHIHLGAALRRGRPGIKVAGIDEIIETLFIALALVILVVYIFIQDWRATLIPTIAIPVSLLGAFVAFPILGFTVNTLSLLGLVLAIGIVVDDAIVVGEHADALHRIHDESWRAAGAGFIDGNGITAHPYHGEANIAAGKWSRSNIAVYGDLDFIVLGAVVGTRFAGIRWGEASHAILLGTIWGVLMLASAVALASLIQRASPVASARRVKASRICSSSPACFRRNSKDDLIRPMEDLSYSLLQIRISPLNWHLNCFYGEYSKKHRA